MELESTNSGPNAKLPIIKLGEYEMWTIRIKQYFQIQDYALWEVIENGDSWVLVSQTSEENGIIVTKMSTPVTAEEKTNKKNDVKTRGLLLMALPNEHQLTFSQYPDAKSMFTAIGTRFGGNAATKKTQKTLLKQHLPPEWNTHVVVWMNKPEVETMSIDDLYNNFKIVKQKVKKTVGTSSGVQNLAFMTAPSSSSTNDANTASSQVSAASPSVNTANPQVCTASVSDNTVGVEAPRSKEGQFRNQDNTRKQGNNEDTSKAMLVIDGVGFDWNMAEEQVQTNMALMAFSDSEGLKRLDQLLGRSDKLRILNIVHFFLPHPLVYNRPNKLDLSYSGLDEFKEPEFKGYGPRNNKKESNVICDKESENSKHNYVKSLVEEQVSQVKSSFVEGSGSNTSKSVSEVEPKKVWKNNDAPIIEDWV
ncbi:hypothetical protein Tco_0676744 [Tanacetum coccineum]